MLLVALGAVAGLAIGMAIADRVGGVEGLLRRTGSARQRRHRDDGLRGDERRSQPFDEFADDESELAPEEIEAQVLARFRDDPQLVTLNIDIGADDDGRVELTGWVPDEEALIHALAVVRGTPGVREVLNGLAIEPTAPR